MSLRRVLMLLGALLVLVCAHGRALGQVIPDAGEFVGPPDSSIIAPPSFDAQRGDELNPLAMLARASSALQRSQDAASAASAASSGQSNGPGLSGPINIVVLMTVITLVPSIMLMTTCFVRIVIVLGLLKQALGTQTLPPPQVIVGLALFMTILVMSPTIERVRTEAIAPYRAGIITDYDQLWAKVKQPMRDFMFDQIEATGNWSSVYMVLNYRGVDTSDPSSLSTANVDMVSLIPAFMLSELKTGFLIGFKVYLPFLVIDMVISGLLISMGMMMLPPVLISLPFKLLLFVLVDGWTLVVGSLLQSFVTHPVPPPPASTQSSMLAPVLGEHAHALACLVSDSGITAWLHGGWT